MDPKQIAVIDDPTTLKYLRGVLDTAIHQGTKVSLHVHTGPNGGIQVKRGESTWTTPMGKIQG